MRYVNEYAVLLDSRMNILAGVSGGPGHVFFPPELIWRIHKFSPGSVYALMHTHPPRSYEPSREDITTLRAIEMAIAPFPMRVGVVSEINEDFFSVTTYLGLYQSKEDYLAKKQTGSRTFEAICEKQYPIYYNDIKYPWLNLLIDKSYQLES